MNRRTLAGALVALAATALAPLALAGPSAWQDYRNDRFGYEVSYPADLLVPQPEAENGDGRHFTARRGHADVAVWAGYANGETLAVAADEAEQTCVGAHAGYKVIRAAKRPPFMALSCTAPDGQVFYAKAYACEDVLTQLQFTYPAAEKATWDPVVTKMSASLGAACGSG
jgi:hypothetical protein